MRKYNGILAAGSSMNRIKQVPRAAFSLEMLPVNQSRQMLATMFQHHLSERYGRVRLKYPLVQALLLMRKLSVLTFTVQGKGIVVALHRAKGPSEVPVQKREWRLLIDPFDASIPLKQMLALEKKYEKELRIVSTDLHDLLVSNPKVKSLRWYFMGWDPKVPAVRSPAELPWDAPSQKLYFDRVRPLSVCFRHGKSISAAVGWPLARTGQIYPPPAALWSPNRGVFGPELAGTRQ
jgi:hypothetical protein